MDNCVRVFLVLFSFVCSLSGQGQVLQGAFNNKVVATDSLLLSIRVGHQFYLLDTIPINPEGGFQHHDSTYSTGYYKLALSDTNFIKLVLSPQEEKVVLRFEKRNLKEGVEVERSLENQLFWATKEESRRIGQKLEPLYKEYEQLRNSPSTPDSSRLVALRREINTLQKRKDSLLMARVEQNPESYFSKVVKQVKVIEDQNDPGYLDHVHWEDPTLLHSNVFPKAIMTYLKKHAEFSESGFQKAVDTVLNRAMVNETVYNYALNYLLQIFDKVGPESLVGYLSRNYIGNSCAELDLDNRLKEQVTSFQALIPGNPAPDFASQDTSGNTVSLSSITQESDYTLLFFWAPECHYCHDAIPMVRKISKEYEQELDLVSVSLGKNREKWINTIIGWKIPGYHLSSLQGWEGTAPSKYMIRKTPSFYILSDEKINSHPSSESLPILLKNELSSP